MLLECNILALELIYSRIACIRFTTLRQLSTAEANLVQPNMASWVQVPEESDFPLRNLPFGVFSTSGAEPRIGVAIGQYVLDLKILAQEGVFDGLKFDVSTLQAPNLNAYAALGKNIHYEVRKKIHQILDKDTNIGNVLRDNQERQKQALILLSNVQMHLPMRIGDYTDFFVGLPHAETVRFC